MSAAPPDRLPASRRDWSSLLDRLGVRPSKGLGQHFLFERGIVARMVREAGIGPDDQVLEIGPGLGILTEELLRRAKSVTAIELDRRLAAHLRATFRDDPRLRLIEGNALQIKTDDLFSPDDGFVVAANLPYAVGSAVLRHLLEQRHRPERLAVMLQMEVAQRLAARPPAMSVLGVATQFYANPRVAFAVPPSVFVPPPAVESAVAILDVLAEPPLPESDQAGFFRIVNAGFRQKRKQVANSLADELRLPKEAIIAWLSEAGVDPMRRAQNLSVDEWVVVTKAAPAEVVGR